MILKINGETLQEKADFLEDYLQTNGIDTPVEISNFIESLDTESLKSVTDVLMDLLKDVASDAVGFITMIF